MTTSESKTLIRLLMQNGMAKEDAFSTAEDLLNTAHQEKMDTLDRFRYEINAEEQRRQGENTTN